MLAKDFLAKYARMEPPLRRQVEAALEKFRHGTHAGMHLEKIADARDSRFRSIRINDSWRGVVMALEDGTDAYMLFEVLPHDDAYQWAKRRRISVNATTGGFEVRDVVAIEETTGQIAAPPGDQNASTPKLLAGVRDADLTRLGIDDQIRPFARALTTLEQLDSSKNLIPAPQHDVLLGLASGLSPEQVWQEMASVIGSLEVDQEDLLGAAERSTADVLIVDGVDELREILNRPFESWRVYLHPLQYRVAHRSHRGPARVTGGPGTGKTVVLLHRARQLAEQAQGPVLLTTFTRALASALRADLHLLVKDPTVLERITVLGADQFAYQIVQKSRDRRPRLLSEQEERRIWEGIVHRLQLPFSEAFLAEEWRHVVLAQDVSDAAGYLRSTRSGRGSRITGQQRAQLWQAVWAFQQELARRDVLTYETMAIEAQRILEQRASKPYRHILVDEAQDLSPMTWRLLRAAVPETHDDLFLAGDPHQRIYAHRVSLRDVGIGVTGRSTRLMINYRTTAEILSWALGVVRGEQIDDMDGDLDSIAGCRSQLRGPEPRLVGYEDRDRELAGLCSTVREWIDDGVDPSEIGVAARSNTMAKTAGRALAGVGVKVDNGSARETRSGGVIVGTMHRAKGMEFRCMVVFGLSEEKFPPKNAVTPVQEDSLANSHDLQRERCLLFVACTRARERLVVSWHGRISPLVLLLMNERP